MFDELLSRGDEVIVTYPEANQGGPLVPELSLVGERCARLPQVAAGSRLELGDTTSFDASLMRVKLGSPRVQSLARYAECGFRYWAERRVAGEEEVPWWLTLVRELRERRKLNAARLGAFKERYPEAAAWLSEVETDLLPLTFGVSLPEASSGPLRSARRGGALRYGDAALYLYPTGSLEPRRGSGMAL